MSYNVKVYDYGTEKQYRIYQKCIRRKGSVDLEIEDIENASASEECEQVQLEGFEEQNKSEYEQLDADKSDNERSMVVSANRTMNSIYELARANHWEYFLTLTFNPDKVNRYDYSEVTKKMTNFLKVMRRKNPDMMYVLVPELHKDGAYHFHGVFSQIPNIDIKDTGIYSFGKYTIHKSRLSESQIEKGRLIYSLDNYGWGYSDIQKVENTEKTANYITKYITKELMQATKGKKRYWASRNLNKPEVQELLLSATEREQLIELLKEKVIHDKVVDVKAEGFTNQVRYIDIKNGECVE